MEKAPDACVARKSRAAFIYDTDSEAEQEIQQDTGLTQVPLLPDPTGPLQPGDPPSIPVPETVRMSRPMPALTCQRPVWLRSLGLVK